MTSQETIKKPINISYKHLDTEEDERRYQEELDKLTDMSFANAGTTRTIKNIREVLSKSIKKKYKIKDKDTLTNIVNGLLKIHGIGESNFDFVNSFSQFMTEKLNDVSIDDNSNKNEKSIKGLLKDCELSIDKIIGYDTLYRTMKELYGQDEAKRLSGEMYDYSLGLADSSNILIPYCWALDASKLVTVGRDFGVLPSKPSKRVGSYVAALCETIHQMSSHLAGAIAIGSFFMDVAHLLIYKERVSLEDLTNDKKTRKRICNEFQQFVHSVNHLSRNGIESPFTNVSVFDKEKLMGLIDDDNYGWYFPKNVKVCVDNNMKGDIINDDPTYNVSKEDYKKFVVDYIFELQKIFVDFFDKGDPLNNGLQYRFPVTTVNLSKHLNEETGCYYVEKDNELLNYISKKDIARYNIFTSSGTKVASCCLASTTKVLIRVDGYVKYVTVKQLFDIWNKSHDEKVIEIMGNSGFTKIVKGYQLPNEGSVLNKITLKNGLVITTTLDHPSVKLNEDGTLTEIKSEYLKVGDMLPLSKNISYNSVLGGDRDFGRFVGLFGAEGQYDLRRDTDIAFSFHTEETELQNFVINFAKDRMAATSNVHISDVWPNSTRVSVNSRIAHAVMRDFFIGNLCTDKRLRSKIFNMSYDFRLGFLEGFIEGDGYTCDNMLTDYGSIHIANKELGRDIVALANSVNIKCSFRNGSNGNDCTINILHNDKLKLKPLSNWKNGEGASNKSTVLTDFNNFYGVKIDKIEKIKTKRGVHVYDFTVENDNHLFQIANGIITHNCRLINDTEMMNMAGTVNSFGGSSISLGSHRVVTVNFVRLAYECSDYQDYLNRLFDRTESAAKILKAHRVLLMKLNNMGLQPFIKNGFINLKRMFSTFGMLGVVEAQDILKQRFNLTDDLVSDILVKYNKYCKELGDKYSFIWNIEEIPGESFAVRLSNADKLIYGNPYNLAPLYSNQFVPLWKEATIYEKMSADGKYNQLLTGGGIVHIQINSDVTPTQAKSIINQAVSCGCEHFALNAVYTKCLDCGTVVKDKTKHCPKCSSKNIVNYTRVVGFFVPVSSWNKVRREWEFDRRTFVDLNSVDKTEEKDNDKKE